MDFLDDLKAEQEQPYADRLALAAKLVALESELAETKRQLASLDFWIGQQGLPKRVLDHTFFSRTTTIIQPKHEFVGELLYTNNLKKYVKIEPQSRRLHKEWSTMPSWVVELFDVIERNSVVARSCLATVSLRETKNSL